MIRIEVEDYCQSCLDFEADVVKPERVYAEGKEFVFTDTVVRCKYRKRCSGITRFLEQQMKGEASG